MNRMETHTPPLFVQNRTPFKHIVHDVLKIGGALVMTIVMDLLGLFVVAVALPFTRDVEQLPPHQPRTLKRLPLWAYQWDNAHDGVEGDDRGSYQFAWLKSWPSRKLRNFGLCGLDWYLMCYNWTAFRNRSNNFTRYTIGFHFFSVVRIDTTDRIMRATDASGHEWPRIVFGTRLIGWKIKPSRSDTKAQIGFAIGGNR